VAADPSLHDRFFLRQRIRPMTVGMDALQAR